MFGGYAGKILYIDLTSKKSTKKPLNRTIVEKFIGGKGFTARLLYDLLAPKTDPFSPDNILIFATGPLNGTIWPGNKNILASKSPLTDIYMDSYFGGGFGPELKFAGYDALVIRGKADTPVYIWIDDANVEFKDARHLWGKNTYETYAIIKKEIGDDTVRITCIGQAGENKVRFACVDADVHRQAGRCGGGAVMGSKNLKAIAVRGSGEIRIAKLKEMEKLAEEFIETLKTKPGTVVYSTLGTPCCLPFASDEGLWPYRNWQDQVFKEGAEEYRGETQRDRLWLKHRSGYQCVMFCEKVGIIKKGPHRGAIVHGVEYETAGLLGASCGYANIEALAYANLLCDYYGLDTISTGAVIAFAMECYENGILKKDDIGGLDLNFGNYEAVHELIKMIAFREGIGNILAEGVERASRIFGKGAEKYAIHVKKLETPAWGVRGAPGMGLQYATTDRGGCHQRGWPIAYEVLGVTPPNGTLVERLSTNRKAAYVKWEQDYTSACGTLIICDLTRYDIDPKYFCCALSLVTGWNIDLEEFLKVGERVWNIIRLFNIREGITRKDDTIPERFIKDPLPSGPAKGHRVTSDDLNKMLEDYYRLRGWTDEGKPTKTKLLELNLEDIQFKDNFDS